MIILKELQWFVQVLFADVAFVMIFVEVFVQFGQVVISLIAEVAQWMTLVRVRTPLTTFATSTDIPVFVVFLHLLDGIPRQPTDEISFVGDAEFADLEGWIVPRGKVLLEGIQCSRGVGLGGIVGEGTPVDIARECKEW